MKIPVGRIALLLVLAIGVLPPKLQALAPVTLNIGNPEELNILDAPPPTTTVRYFFFPFWLGFPASPSYSDVKSIGSEPNKLWLPTKTVRYKFEIGFSNEFLVAKAIKEIEENTCIKFLRVYPFLYYGDHLIIRHSEKSCRAHIGYKESMLGGGQEIWLSNACKRNTGAVLHYLLKVLGVFYQHTRSDREAHIKILNKNVKSSKKARFSIHPKARLNGPFDLTSVSHFGLFAHSKNRDPTFNTIDPLDKGLIVYPRETLSFTDKLNVNTMYGCIDDWKKCNGGSNKCENLGYLGKDCKCVCPAGSSGDTCSNKTESYTEGLRRELLPLSKEESTNTTANISSPSFPAPDDANITIFTKVIKASKCNEVKVTIDDFKLADRCANKWCCREGLELQLNKEESTGKFYCGSELYPKTELKTKGGQLVLFYYKDKIPGNINPGFQVSLSEDPIPGCEE